MLLTEKLTVKYHPQQISDFIGLDNVKPVLLSYIASPQPQVFLFEGPSGTGKTSMAFALAKALGVHEGMIARTHALRCNLEWVKKISSDCDFHPTLGNWWFYLIDEAEEMTRPAQIDLLNILDPPPPRGIFVFTANLPEKVVKVVRGERGKERESGNNRQVRDSISVAVLSTFVFFLQSSAGHCQKTGVYLGPGSSARHATS